MPQLYIIHQLFAIIDVIFSDISNESYLDVTVLKFVKSFSYLLYSHEKRWRKGIATDINFTLFL
jgi:hypothetical protein